MPQTLRLTNYSGNNIVDQTELTANVAAGSGSLAVQNANDFNSGYVLVGPKNSKQAELLPASLVTSGTVITLTSNTVLQHNQYDPVYSLFGNQLKIYRAADAGLGQQPPDNAFSLLATINIDPNDDATSYTDSTGGGSFWYKYTFYNQGNAGETTLSSATAVRGNFTVNYCSLDEIRQRAGFQSAPYITDVMIDAARQAAQDEINGALDAFYVTPLQPPINDYIRDICVRLAVARLLQDQYGQTAAGTTADGDKKMKDAQADLKKLIMKERVLTDKQGHALDEAGATGGVEGWPNSSTKTAQGSSGGAQRVFRMSDIQGRSHAAGSSGNVGGNLYFGRRW